MVGRMITKSLGVVLIIAAHMVFTDCSRTPVTGILGTNITLQFPFNISIPNESVVSIYKEKDKVAQYQKGKSASQSNFYVYLEDSSVFFHITDLQRNNSGLYKASLFIKTVPTESEPLQLTVSEQNRSITVPPVQDDILIPDRQGSSISSHIITAVLVVLPVVVLAAAFTWLFWCLMKEKDENGPSPQQNSNLAIQETPEVSSHIPAASLVYSVLDFPKRASAVVEMNSCDTEYAVVSYH